MTFNVEKCKCVHVGRNNPKRSYHMRGKELSVTTVERDLGVYVVCSQRGKTPTKTVGETSSNFVVTRQRSLNEQGRMPTTARRHHRSHAFLLLLLPAAANGEIEDGATNTRVTMLDCFQRVTKSLKLAAVATTR